MSFRGHKTDFDGEKWVYEDNKPIFNSETNTYNERPCTKCGLIAKDDVDPCLGRLPGVKFACCGHGDVQKAYIMFEDGFVIRHFDEIETFRLEEGDERKI